MSLRRLSAAETPETRARALLHEVLSHAERVHFIETGHVVITGSQGGRYRVHTHTCIGNIEVLSDVRLRTGSNWFSAPLQGRRLCAHPRNHRFLPPFDNYVAQVLAIKADEKQFVRTCYLYV